MNFFNGKLFFLTGGARGLGKNFLQVIVQNGGKVIFVDILFEIGVQTEAELNLEYTGMVKFYKGDVTNHKSMEKAWIEGEQHFGRRVDVLVNNAGVMDAPGWKKHMDVNIIAVVSLCYMAFHRMSKSLGGRGGTIINISSMAAFGVAPYFEMVPYCVSKSAVVSLTRSLGRRAFMNKHGIRVTAICPFFVDTDIILKGLARNADDSIHSLTEKYGGLLTCKRVVKEFVKSVSDTSNSGKVLQIVPGRNAEYLKFPNLFPPPASKL